VDADSASVHLVRSLVMHRVLAQVLLVKSDPARLWAIVRTGNDELPDAVQALARKPPATHAQGIKGHQIAVPILLVPSADGARVDERALVVHLCDGRSAHVLDLRGELPDALVQVALVWVDDRVKQPCTNNRDLLVLRVGR